MSGMRGEIGLTKEDCREREKEKVKERERERERNWRQKMMGKFKCVQKNVKSFHNQK